MMIGNQEFSYEELRATQETSHKPTTFIFLVRAAPMSALWIFFFSFEPRRGYIVGWGFEQSAALIENAGCLFSVRGSYQQH